MKLNIYLKERQLKTYQIQLKIIDIMNKKEKTTFDIERILFWK